MTLTGIMTLCKHRLGQSASSYLIFFTSISCSAKLIFFDQEDFFTMNVEAEMEKRADTADISVLFFC